MRLLVLDAYPREGRAALVAAGGTEAGTLYADLLKRIEPDAIVDVVYPADLDSSLPHGTALADYDGACWTGSSLTIHADDPKVRRQVEVAREAFQRGVPSFGSCWACQLAVVAAGGECAASPKGREFGVARRIELSERGRAHPLYRGKPGPFDALASHADEARTLPPGTELLASNAWSRVQAVSIQHRGGSFWAVQYHPEYDLSEVAALARLRTKELVEQGTFPDGAACERYIQDMTALEREPSREDVAARLGVAPDLQDPDARTREVRNWIEHAVRARASAR